MSLLAALVFGACDSDRPADPPVDGRPDGSAAVDTDDAGSASEDDSTDVRPAEPPEQPDSWPEEVPSAEKPPRQWLIELGSTDVKRRRVALEHFDTIGGDAVREFLAALADPSPEVRRGAAFGLLGRFDDRVPQMVEAFMEALDDDDRAVRHIALQAFNEMDRALVLDAVPRLAAMLDPDREEKHIRQQIVRKLGQLGPDARAALVPLARAAETDPESDVRAAALYALSRVAESPADALPAMQKILREDADPKLRRLAAVRMAQYGDRAAGAVGALAAALEDKSPTVRAAAADTLAAIGPPAASALAERFTHKDREVRMLAIYAVGKIGPNAKHLAPKIEPLLEDDDKDVRSIAELTLRRIGVRP